MSTLQIGLAILGVLLLAALAGHALWRARQRGDDRLDRGASSARSVAEGDPLREPQFGPLEPIAHDGVEPVVDAPITPPGPIEVMEPAMVEATGQTMVQAIDPTLRPAGRRGATARLDGLLDAIATVTVEQPIAGEAAIAHLPATRRAGSKPVLIEGLDAETGTWEMPQPQHRYGEFQAGVQLANRTGALNEIEYSEFVQKVQAFADALGGAADFPDMLDAVARARELDAFANDHDAQLVLQLACGRAAWTLGYVAQHAQRHGFVAGVLPGRLALPSAEDGAPPVLTLLFDPQAALADEPHNATLRDLRLAFDVPQTAQAEQPFAAWCAAGEALALALDASLLDDRGQPLDPAAFATIAGDLEQLYAALAERDLAAGSAAARRLFS